MRDAKTQAARDVIVELGFAGTDFDDDPVALERLASAIVKDLGRDFDIMISAEQATWLTIARHTAIVAGHPVIPAQPGPGSPMRAGAA